MRDHRQNTFALCAAIMLWVGVMGASSYVQTGSVTASSARMASSTVSSAPPEILGEPIAQIGGSTHVIIPDPRAENRAIMGVGPRLATVDTGGDSGSTILGMSDWLEPGAVIEDLALSGDVVVAVTGGAKVFMLDVTDPSIVRLVSNISLTTDPDDVAKAMSVVIVEEHAYVRYGVWRAGDERSSHRVKLAVVDIRDASSPRLVNADALPGDLAPIDFTAYPGGLAVTVADDIYAGSVEPSFRALWLLDVSDPASPRRTVEHVDARWHLLARQRPDHLDSVIYGFGGEGGLSMRVRPGGTLQDHGRYMAPLDGPWNMWDVRGHRLIVLEDGVALFEGQSGFGDTYITRLMDEDWGRSPVEAIYFAGAPQGGLASVGPHVIASKSGGQVLRFETHVVEDSDTVYFERRDSLNLIGHATDIASIGPESSVLAISASIGGIRTLDVADPTEPLPLQMIHDVEYRSGLAVGPEWIVTGALGQGDALRDTYEVFSLRDKHEVDRRGYIPVSNWFSQKSLVRYGDHLFAVVSNSGDRAIVRIDLSGDGIPEPHAFLSPSGTAYDMDVSGNLLGVAYRQSDETPSFLLYELGEAGISRRLADISLPVRVSDKEDSLPMIALDGTTAWLAAYNTSDEGETRSMLYSVDLSVPERAAVVSEMELPGAPSTLHVRDGLLFLGIGRSIYVVDGRLSGEPSMIGRLSGTYGGGRDGIVTRGGHVFIAGGGSGTWVYELPLADLPPVPSVTPVPTITPTLEPTMIPTPTPEPAFLPLVWR